MHLDLFDYAGIRINDDDVVVSIELQETIKLPSIWTGHKGS
jgi:hypothetical protein